MKRFLLLGQLQILEDGQPADIVRSPKGSALVAYLLVTQKVVERETMADLLWEAPSTQRSLHNLRQLLTRIRPWLPELQITRQSLAYQPGDGVYIDLYALEKGLQSKDVTRQEAALSLYQGDLLAGFYVANAPRFNEWLLLSRENLRRQVMEASHRLCESYLAQQAWQAGVAAARRWLALDDLHEEAHRWFMRFLAGEGLLTQAVDHYEQFRQRLRAELDVAPETATEELAQQLAERETQSTLVSLPPDNTLEALPTDELPVPGFLPPNSSIPFLRNVDFVNREAELLQIATTLREKPTHGRLPVAGLTGIGGMGKTQTAVEFCYRYGRYFPGGVFWLSFAEAENVAEEVAAIGGEHGLGLFQEGERLTLADRVGRVRRAWQEPTPRLLVFDNCEEVDLLAKWLPVSGGCRVLVTSRRAVWPRELQVTAVPLLPLPSAESICLLQRLAPHLGTEPAQDIAIEVGHLPLALHLAGSFFHRYRQINPVDYARHLRKHGALHHPSLQGRGVSYSPTGHVMDVARTYALSFEQFDANDPADAVAQRLLGIVACFAPGEPVRRILVQAVAVPDENDIEAILLTEDGLNRLTSLGFLSVEAGEMLVMHRLVAAYTRLVLADEAEAVRAVEETMARLITAVWEKELFLRELPFAPSQLRYVTDQALKRQDSLTASLANYLGRHLTDNKEYAQAEPYLVQALSIRQNLLGEHMDTAVSLTTMGTLLWQWKSNAAAMPYFEEAHRICERLLGPDHPKTARSLNNLATLYSRQGHYDIAQAYFEKTIAIYEHVGAMDDAMVPSILANMAVMFRRQGNFAQARTYYERVLRMKEARLGSEHYQTIITLFGWANLMILMGHYQAAQPALEHVIAVRKKLPDGEATTAAPYIRLGELQIIAGRYAEAQSYLDRSLFVLEMELNKENINWGWVFAKQGHLNRLKGEFVEAESVLQRALSRFEQQPPHYFGNIETYIQLTDLYLQTGQLAAAKKIADDALAICHEYFSEGHPFTAQVRLRLGEWYQLQGNVDTAQVIFEEVRVVLETVVAPTHIDFIRLQKCLAGM